MLLRVVLAIMVHTIFVPQNSVGGCWLCSWQNWNGWSGCSRTCAGGIRRRTRRPCCLPHFVHQNDWRGCQIHCRLWNGDTETQQCNNKCMNGGTFYGYDNCHCTESYTGVCCNHFVCPLIDYCIHRSCTNARNVQCTRCQGVVKDNPGFRAYVLSKNKKACIQACSWRSDSKWCYPGTCDNEYATNCNCSDGFTGPNCMTMEDPPSIEYNELVLNKDTPDEKSIPDDVNEWPVKTPSWTNMQNITTMEYDFRATYKPGYKLPEKHAFIKEYHVGITNGTVELNFYPQKENQTGYSELYICGNATVKNPEKNTLKCYNDNLNVSSIIPPTLNTGDMLELLFNTENGGFVEVEDKELSSITEHFYKGHRKQSVIRLGFDYVAPYHCVEEGCTTQTLNVPKAALVSNPNISWSGWNDNTSGLAYYDIEVFQMKYTLAEAGLKTGGRDHQKRTNENSFHLRLSTEGLLSVELTAFDRAGNMKMTRRIMIYDETSVVETRSNTTLLVTTASPLSEYSWQWTSGSVKIEWTSRYINTRHISNHWLERVLPQPNIDPDYDDQDHSRGVDKIDNIQGIVRFETSYRIDHNGGKSITVPAEFTSIGLNQSQVLTPSLVDGDTLRYWIRAYDIRDEFLEENVTVHIDTSPPVLGNISWNSNFSGTYIEWESYDEDSGLEVVSWKVFASASGKEIIYGQQLISLQGETKNESECPSKLGISTRATHCYCTPGFRCLKGHFLVQPDAIEVALLANKMAFIDFMEYLLEVTVINHAGLKTQHTEKIRRDRNALLPGIVHIGRRGESDVTNQSNLMLHAYWDGFSDTDFEFLFYQVKFDTSCSTSTHYELDKVDGDVLKVSTTNITWTAPGPGIYVVTVVAFNQALQLSSPVCSDGVVVTPDESAYLPTIVGSSIATMAVIICAVVVLAVIVRRKIRTMSNQKLGKGDSIEKCRSRATGQYENIAMVPCNTDNGATNTSPRIPMHDGHTITGSIYNNLNNTTRDLDIRSGYASFHYDGKVSGKSSKQMKAGNTTYDNLSKTTRYLDIQSGYASFHHDGISAEGSA